MEMRKTKSLNVLNIMSSGQSILLPYDASSGTMSPALVQGRRSHYAVLVGVAYARPHRHDEDAGSVAVVDLSKHRGSLENEANTTGRLIVVLQHSASAYPLIAAWDDVVRSNMQLLGPGSAVPSRIRRKYRINKDRGGPNLAGLSLVCSVE